MTLKYAEYEAIAAKINPNGQAFIDEKCCDPADGKKFEAINPAKGQVLGRFVPCKTIWLQTKSS